MAERYTLLYILGSGHCGSTLLDLLLNGHSQILGLGEITTLNKPFKSLQISNPMAMGYAPLYKSFWQEVKRCYENSGGRSFDEINISHPNWRSILSWQPDDVQRWAQPNYLLLSCIQQLSGAVILTDASKFPHRLYLLQRSEIFNIQVVHMLRDGRAVINSYIRKYNNFRLALRRWAAPSILAFYLRRDFAKADWLQVRYEELATRTEETLKNICTFLNVDFESKMLAYRGQAYVGLGGNRMRENKDEKIMLDEGWRWQLSRKHRLAFALGGGWLNRLYKY